MKKIKKNNALLIGIIFGLITLGSLILRFNHYEKLVNFHLDPPLFLNEVQAMVEAQKIRLIGPLVATKVIEGRYFFTGPTFYWLLAVLGILLNWDVLLMTAFFAFWWVGTFILIFFWLKRRFGFSLALILYSLISFIPYLVPYSRMIWNPHFIPFFGVLLLWALEERRKRRLNYFLAGLSFGLGLSIHYSAILFIPLILYFFINDFRKKSFSFLSWLFFFGGVVLVESPLLLFEIRHDFYNLRTILFQVSHLELSAGYSFGFYSHEYYYLFPLVPLMVKAYALFLKKLKKAISFRVLLIPHLVLIIFFFLYSLLGPQREAAINPKGWSLARQKEVAQMIIEDNEKGFEVATIINSDTRAGELRWWLKQMGHEPMGVEEYNQTDILYLVAPETRPVEDEKVYEIQSLRPFEVQKQVDIGDNYIFYKLRRLSKEEP